MSHHLRSCVRCARHIRITETTCPFCAAPVPVDRKTPPALGKPSARMQRAFALSAMAAAAGGVGAVSSCGSATEPPVISAADAYGIAADVYPITEPDSGRPDAPADAASEADVVTGVAAYGGVEFPDAMTGSDAEGPDEGTEGKDGGGEEAGDSDH